MILKANFGGLAIIFFQSHLLQPHFQYPAVSDIPFQSLYDQGIRGIIFDRDSCLTPPRVMSILPTAQKGLEDCIRIFGKGNIFCLSNSAGLLAMDPTGVKAEKLEKLLDIPVMKHIKTKPDDELKEEILSVLPFKANEIAFIGDRLMTDIALANKMGSMAIHTTDIVPGATWQEKFARFLELLFVPSGLREWDN